MPTISRQKLPRPNRKWTLKRRHVLILIAASVTIIFLYFQVDKPKAPKASTQTTPNPGFGLWNVDNLHKEKQKEPTWEKFYSEVMKKKNKTNKAIFTGTSTTSKSSAGLSVTSTSSGPMWESSSILPPWLKDYFTWHKQQLKLLEQEWKPVLKNMMQPQAASFVYNGTATNNDNSNNQHRFLILRCFSFDRTCGGLADRLLPLPYLLQVAHNSSRILFIHFEKPAPLQSYLLPPQGGMDWRIPGWLLPGMNFTPDSKRYKSVAAVEEHAHTPEEIVVQCIFQIWHYGTQPYNERRSESELKFKFAAREVWRMLFTPTLALQQRIRNELQQMGLQEGNYMGIHMRVVYGIPAKDRDPADTIKWTRNAIHCASLLRPEGPFFVASDSVEATRVAVQYGELLLETAQTTTNPLVVTRADQDAAPLHFDRLPVDPENQQAAAPYQPSDYDDTYVDLFLLAMSNCVSFGMGGYGKLASFLSYNVSCSSLHIKNRLMQECQWKGAGNNVNDNTQRGDNNAALSLPSLLAPPME